MPVQIVKDVRNKCGQVRDQGSRPTCLAFAASDTHAALRSPWMPLSCEFAFYHAQRRAGRLPTNGAMLPFMLQALEQDGQPIEASWPYLPALPSDISKWVPPANVGDCFRRRGSVNSALFNEIIAVLDSDRPAIVGIMLSDAFYLPDSNGRVESPEPPDPARRHAVVAVAHGVWDKKRCVLVRNSWGPTWGMTGHAWLMEPYLTSRLLVIAALMEEPNVSSDTLAA